MAKHKIVFICILALLALHRQGAAQESQEVFSKSLIAACRETDVSGVKDLVSAHRLWVKPVVNELISEYIHRTMIGDKKGALERKDAILLISQNFRDIYSEKSLYLAYSYLETWGLEQLGKKAQVKYWAEWVLFTGTSMLIPVSPTTSRP